MDDLVDLNWSSTTPNPTLNAPPLNPAVTTSYPALRPSPSPFASGINTPLSSQGSGASGPKAPAKTIAPDSFSNLVSFGSSKPSNNLSLREQQQRLQAEKRRKEEEEKKKTEAQFGNGQQWDSLGSNYGSRTASPAIAPPSSAVANGPALGTSKTNDDDDDLFAAFKAETKVDNASYYPPPTQTTPAPAMGPDLTQASAWARPALGMADRSDLTADDDDPFGLNTLRERPPATLKVAEPQEDDDFLGDLGRPVEEVRRKQQVTRNVEPGKPIEDSDSDSSADQEEPVRASDPFDKAVAQLVDYGFTPENARRGLTESGAGINVQAAVNWLLDDAHRQSKQQAQGARDRSAGPQPGREARSSRDPTYEGDTSQGRNSQQMRDRRTGFPESDLSKTAAAVGSNLLKTANSFWKTSQKKVQKAVADFQQQDSGDPNQPKWMRSAQQDRLHASEKKPDVTDEALMLESGTRPAGRPSRTQGPATSRAPREFSPRDHSPALSGPSSGRNSPAPRLQQPTPPLDTRSRLSRLAKDDDDLSAYISPNRRRRAAPPSDTVPQQQQPPPQRTEQKKQQPPVQRDEPNLLFGTDEYPAPRAMPQHARQRTEAPPTQASRAPQTKPAAVPKPAPRPKRQIPAISPSALQSSTRLRLEGTAHFKRGDFAAARDSYSSSLAALPPSHPLAIVLLTNRALTNIKNGEPKQAIEDAEGAINAIGPSYGQGETIAVVGENGAEEHRSMKELYGKALARKAEALEHMERWADAGAVWQLCVEANLGGPTAAAGRQRCQKALAPKPKPAPRPAAPSKPRPSAAANLGPQKNSAAVERLRAANEAAAKEEDEKFVIAERVDARIATWRDGKRENLRALLGSLDQVLWEDSGWKKVGLHELVMANKVKIIYMKAIAKTHPDKVPQNANTEVRLIAATVFSTLNEGWDKFKAENGL